MGWVGSVLVTLRVGMGRVTLTFSMVLIELGGKSCALKQPITRIRTVNEETKRSVFIAEAPLSIVSPAVRIWFVMSPAAVIE